MGAYLKLEGVDGESTDAGHEKWIIIESMHFGGNRSIDPGARDAQRARGTTLLSEQTVVRQMDKTSPKLWENMLTGTQFKEVEVHLTQMVNNKQEPYYIAKLKDVIITHYSAGGNDQSIPTEDFSLNYTSGEWTYQCFNKDGTKGGKAVATFDLGKQGKK